MGKQVFIKSIPRETASKIHEWRDGRTNKKLNKTKISDNCKDGLQALYSSKVGGLKTGLYKTMRDEDGNEVKLQDYAEKKWGLDSGTLTNRPFRKGDALSEDTMTYFQKKVWKLNDGSTVLELDNLDDWCFYHVCIESKYIANSEREWREHKWPKAMFYISLENEPDSIKYKKTQRKAKAYASLGDKDFTLAWKRKFIVLLKITSSRTTITEDQTFNLLYDYIDKSELHDSMTTNINKFFSYFEKLKKKDQKIRLEADYTLQQLVDWRVVREKSGTYTWLAKDIELGFNRTEAVDFLTDPNKQTFIEELEEALTIKRVK